MSQQINHQMNAEITINRSSKQVQGMFNSIAHRYDRANTVLSFGIHHLWRSALMKMAPKIPNGVALDLCTGTGDLLPHLEQRYAHVFGADFSIEMLRAGKLNGPTSRSNAPVVQASALNLPFADRKLRSSDCFFWSSKF